MSDILKKFEDQVKKLKTEFEKLRDEFDRSDSSRLNSIVGQRRIIADKIEDLKAESIKTTDVKEITRYHVEQIEHELGRIERGVNVTGSIIEETKKIAELFDRFEETKKDLEHLESDCDMLNSDIKEELERQKITSIANQIVKRSK